MTECSKIVICCVILHNLCIQFGDQWFEEEDDGEEDQGHAPGDETNGNQREKRRNEILTFFAQRQSQEDPQ
jgi:hypothetical protein